MLSQQAPAPGERGGDVVLPGDEQNRGLVNRLLIGHPVAAGLLVHCR
jgi:hypothetical protein